MRDTKTAADASMPLDQPRITAKIAGRSLYLLLRPYAVGYFYAVLAYDLLYFLTQSSADRHDTVAEFGMISEWLLAAGLIVAALSNVSAFVDFCGERRFRELPDIGLYTSGNLLVFVLGFCNLYLRLTDGSAAVMERGLMLSLSTLVVLLCIPWQDWNRLYR